MPSNRTSVYFSESEDVLLKYASSQEASFSNYVKKLIKEDMKKADNFEQKVIEVIEKYLSDRNISITPSQTSDYNEKDKEELMNMLNL